MSTLFKNPVALIFVLCLAGLLIGQAFTLIGLARGDRHVREEAAKWSQALGGGVAGRKRSDAQLNDLHQAVESLKQPPDDGDPRPLDR
jgi:hypothetical protein